MPLPTCINHLKCFIGLLFFIFQTTETAYAVTYADDVAPIIQESCITCHNPNGIGPFSLTNYEEVRRRGRQISEVTQSRYMPPWKPDADYGPALIGERRLSESQIQSIQSWYASGMESGDLSKLTPYTPPTNEWQLGTPDLIIQLDEPFRLPAEAEDIYQNFVIPLPINKTVYVRAFELMPESRLAIHHALLTVDNTRKSRERDAADPGPGWNGMEIGGDPPAGHIIGWTPGQEPYQAYPGTAWKLTPGDDLVLQLHMLPTGKPESVNPKLALFFADKEPTLPSYVFQLRNYDIDIPPEDSNYLRTGSMRVPVPVKVVSVYPHAHYLGKDIQLYAKLPNGDTQWLLRIPDWDFNWQGDYRFKDPIDLPAQSTLHMAYTFDNSSLNPRNPSSPPKRVTGGWRSYDEMAEAMIQVIPSNKEDLELLVETQLQYDFELAGGEARYHYYNGIALEQVNEPEQALKAYLKSIELDPEEARAYARVGDLLYQRGEIDDAEAYFDESLAYEPALVTSRLGKAKILLYKKQLRPAGFILKELYSEMPDNLQITMLLSNFYRATNDPVMAQSTMEQGLKYFSKSASFRMEYGRLLLSLSQLSKAEIELQEALRIERNLGNNPKLLSATHYLLATLHQKQGELKQATMLARQSLDLNADYLEALLLSASLAIELGDIPTARKHLHTLVARPENETYPYQDILANIPLSTGADLLVEAYESAGKPELAEKSLRFSETLKQE
jgi:tetratricopeptide (TPR) repeat protein